MPTAWKSFSLMRRRSLIRVSRMAKTVSFRFIVAGTLLVGIAVGIFAARVWRMRDGASGRYNVLFITIDTLRADHLGCYGYGKDTSPRIDELARNGILFENVFAQRSLTWPSLATIMTSTYPHIHGVRRQGVLLPDETPALATVLFDNGYDTAGFTANCSGQNWRGFRDYQAFNIEGGAPGGTHLTDAVIKWLRDRGSRRRFFIWAHYIAPHASYDPPAPYRERFVGGEPGRYDAEIATLESYRAGQNGTRSGGPRTHRKSL